MLMDDWIKDVKAKGGVDRDGHYGKQCMDLYNDFCHRVLEVEGKTGCAEARLIITKDKTIKKYTKQIKNTPSFIPQKGDIAVWTGGTYGHVAIVRDNKSTVNVLRTIDQNWTPLKLTEVNHNYIDYAPLYFLRPLDQSNINPVKEEAEELVKEEIKQESNVAENASNEKQDASETVMENKEEIKNDSKEITQEESGNIFISIIKTIIDFIVAIFKTKSK